MTIKVKINKETFLKGGGWRHLLVGQALLFILRFWGATDYAQTTLRWPSSMMASLSGLGNFWQFFIYQFFLTVLAIVVEMLQEDIWHADFSWSDVVYTSLIGGTIGFFLFNYYPSNDLIFWINCILVPGLLVQWVYKNFYSRP